VKKTMNALMLLAVPPLAVSGASDAPMTPEERAKALKWLEESRQEFLAGDRRSDGAAVEVEAGAGSLVGRRSGGAYRDCRSLAIREGSVDSCSVGNCPIRWRPASVWPPWRRRSASANHVFVERLWRSLKYELIYLGDFDSGAELMTALDRYFRFYHHRRPHQAFGIARRQTCFRAGRCGRSHYSNGELCPPNPWCQRPKYGLTRESAT
jgi:hypothetical protein